MTTGQPRCERCRRFVKAGVQHCDDCAVRLYAFFVPNEMHWREVFRERERAVSIDETGYGYPSCVRDPRDFLPDLECSSEHERLRWVEACQIAESFGDPDMSGNRHINANGFHVSRTAWGLGSYIWRESEAA